MNRLGLGNLPTFEIVLDEKEGGRKMRRKFTKTGEEYRMPIFTDGEDVSGKVICTMGKCKKLDQNGIKIELIGQQDIISEQKSSEFLQLARDLEPPCALSEDKEWEFAFNKVEKRFESYYGCHARIKYFLRVTVSRQYAVKLTKELDFLVENPTPEPDVNNPIKMEVGIEECLHIEFEYNKGKFHMKEVLEGVVRFLLVRIKLKYMELAIIKKEIMGVGNNASSEPETLAKFEVMDGCPVKGEIVPIRMFLRGFELTPTYMEVNHRFSVRYFINLVLVDEEDRRYFKQQEITLWRHKI